MDKAKELVDKFYKADEIDKPTGLMERELARQCALICVKDRIDFLQTISDLKSIIVINDIEYTVVHLIREQLDIKNKIEKL